MAITWSAVTCCEEHGSSRREDWTDQGLNCSVVLRCAYSNRHLLAADVVGGRRVWPFNSLARAKSCSIVPFPSQAATDGQGLIFEDALVTVNYSQFDGDPTDLVSESLEPSIQFITLDHKLFRWKEKTGDVLQEEEAPGRQMYSLSLKRTLFKREPPLPTGLLDLPGSVNDTPYTSALLGLTFPAETLLFAPGSLSRTIKSDFSGTAFDINLNFVYQKQGWNKFWRQKTQDFERIVVAETGANYDNYPQEDFSDFLF